MQEGNNIIKSSHERTAGYYLPRRILTTLRKKKSLTCNELGKKIGVEEGLIEEFENHYCPISYDISIKLGKEFGVSPRIFFPIMG